MIANTKTFYAVGQGGFYSEKIQYERQTYTIVYDCGSVGSKSKLVQAINNSTLDKVDCIVLSHLDRDHVNGLSDLQKYLKKMSPDNEPLLILPNPSPLDLLIFFSNSSDKEVDAYFQLMKNKRILLVTNDRAKEDVVYLDDIRGQTKVSHNALFISHKNAEDSCKWQLKLYVEKMKYDGLSRSEQDFIQGIKSIDDFNRKEKGSNKKNKDRLRAIYKKIPGGMNCSSMAMISAPYDKDIRVRNSMNENGGPFVSWMNGDICLKDKAELVAIEKHFKDYLSLNIDFQIPHHGSRNNFERLPAVNRRIRTYIWAGEDNKHGHPDGTVLRKLQKSGVEIKWITEEDEHIVRNEIWV